jgi:class 3 adenylate cyclase
MSFRIKLLLAMMLVVGAVTTATLLATQQKVQSAYEEIFEDQFKNQISYFSDLQETRLSGTRENALTFAKSVRVVAAMIEYQSDKSAETAADLYKVLQSELRRPGSGFGPRGPSSGGPNGSNNRGGGGGPFSLFLDDEGKALQNTETNRFRNTASPRDLEHQVENLGKAMRAVEQQQVGYLAPAIEATNARLHEVILTKIIDPATDHILGALVLGFPVSDQSDRALSKMSQIQSGVLLDGEIHSSFIPENARALIAAQVGAQPTADEGRFPLRIGERPHTVFYRALNRDSAFPRAYQICVYSLDEPVRVQKELRSKILLFGGLAMLAALAVSLVLSQGLSGPIHELVAGTRAVEKGDFEVRVAVRSSDEIGELAQSFNQMTAGLALKEKYRSVLDMVADKRIAEDLLNGKIALGGEEREVSVLFCDIRGFTALTQNMEPPEVIQMLNEHFTPLTRVVYEHHGVVDKFVGDLIMAIFGAPTTHGNEALNAARCALRMLEERAKLNANSNYQITIGIGIVTGKAVAGRVGSVDRLNYTVLGPSVNLASRLCGQAGRMEVVIDENTLRACEGATAEPLPEMKLKGFSQAVHAYKLTALPRDET